MKNPQRFYTYAYLRVNGTPYYIGKGVRSRAYAKNHGKVPVPPKERILILKKNLLEEKAFQHEIYMIAVFGRKDLGTGILLNRSDGGEGATGNIQSLEARQKISQVQIGKIKYGVRRPICGVGINDADYSITYCPYYKKWRSIIQKCYGYNTKKNKGYVVCDEWIIFSNFKKWMEVQDWENKQLDKNILSPNNKIYSPEYCIFVDFKTANLINLGKKKKYNFPIGISYNKKDGRYQCSCNTSEKTNFGYYKTAIEAHKYWQLSKSKYILEVADKQNDVKVKNALVRISNNIMEDYKNNIETKEYR